MQYSEKLKDPLWKKKRKEILAHDGFKCRHCPTSDTELHVHHKYYLQEKEPWDYPDDCFITLCCDCHDSEHSKLVELDNHILNCLRQNFMADEISEICEGFLNIKPDHIPEISAKMIQWLFSNREAMDIAFRMYFMCLEKSKT